MEDENNNNNQALLQQPSTSSGRYDPLNHTPSTYSNVWKKWVSPVFTGVYGKREKVTSRKRTYSCTGFTTELEKKQGMMNLHGSYEEKRRLLDPNDQ